MNLIANRKECVLMILDLQEKLFPHIDRGADILERISFMILAAKLAEIPMIVTEQYPKGLGSILPQLKSLLPSNQKIFEKTAFSGYYDLKLRESATEKKIWVLMGIETHICVLQTAKDLIQAQKKVIIINDATSSRSIYDFSTALDELRSIGCSILSAEAVVYEWVRDASDPLFKKILPLVKVHG